MSQPIECQEHPEHNASETTTLDTIWCGNCRVNFDAILLHDSKPLIRLPAVVHVACIIQDSLIQCPKCEADCNWSGFTPIRPGWYTRTSP